MRARLSLLYYSFWMKLASDKSLHPLSIKSCKLNRKSAARTSVYYSKLGVQSLRCVRPGWPESRAVPVFARYSELRSEARRTASLEWRLEAGVSLWPRSPSLSPLPPSASPASQKLPRMALAEGRAGWVGVEVIQQFSLDFQFWPCGDFCSFNLK